MQDPSADGLPGATSKVAEATSSTNKTEGKVDCALSLRVVTICPPLDANRVETTTGCQTLDWIEKKAVLNHHREVP